MPVPSFATSSSSSSSGGSSGSSSIPSSRLHAAASSNSHSHNHSHHKKVSHYLILLQTTFGLVLFLFGCTTLSLYQRFDTASAVNAVNAVNAGDAGDAVLGRVLTVPVMLDSQVPLATASITTAKQRRAVASNNDLIKKDDEKNSKSQPEQHKPSNKSKQIHVQKEDRKNHPKSNQPIPPLRDKEESVTTTQNPAKIATKIPAKSGDKAAPATTAAAATTTTITSTSSPSPNTVTTSSTTTNKTNTELPPPSQQQQQISKPQKIILAHVPRYDLLGSFVAPSLFLHAITSFYKNKHHHWELAILPFQGSEQERILQGLVAQGTNIDKAWGSGLTEANSRHDYDPVQINAMAHATMGFFPPILNTTTTSATSGIKWIRYDTIVKNGILVPPDHSKWTTICQKATNNNDTTCHVLLSDNPHLMQTFMEQHGGLGLFFTPQYRQSLRDAFMVKNRHRLQHYYNGTTETTTPQNNDTYMIAIHVRRGDILDPKRWIKQSVYAKVAQRICRLQSQQHHKQVHMHIFTSGPNKDGNWKELEALAKNTTNTNHNATTNTKTIKNHNDNDNDGQAFCSSVSIHRDEQEFDSWTHMIMADAFIMSKSSFSEIPAILARGQVYFPHDYWHPKLPHWTIFHSQTGRLLPQS